MNKQQTNYTQEQMQNGEIVGISAVTGMEAKVWQGNDGWYSEVADPNDYCQGAAFGVATREAAVTAAMDEIAAIDATAHHYQ